jgi:lysophospholipase L1-like esterase
VALGGFDGVDRNHYSAAGQQLLGERMAKALLELQAKLPMPTSR